MDADGRAADPPPGEERTAQLASQLLRIKHMEGNGGPRGATTETWFRGDEAARAPPGAVPGAPVTGILDDLVRWQQVRAKREDLHADPSEGGSAAAPPAPPAAPPAAPAPPRPSAGAAGSADADPSAGPGGPPPPPASAAADPVGPGPGPAPGPALGPAPGAVKTEEGGPRAAAGGAAYLPQAAAAIGAAGAYGGDAGGGYSFPALFSSERAEESLAFVAKRKAELNQLVAEEDRRFGGESSEKRSLYGMLRSDFRAQQQHVESSYQVQLNQKAALMGPDPSGVDTAQIRAFTGLQVVHVLDMLVNEFMKKAAQLRSAAPSEVPRLAERKESPPAPHKRSRKSEKRPEAPGAAEAPKRPAEAAAKGEAEAEGPAKKRRTRKNLSRESRAILNNWLTEHWNDPYPTQDEKLQLSREAKITIDQVNNWFINARVRLWRPKLQGKNPPIPPPAARYAKAPPHPHRYAVPAAHAAHAAHHRPFAVEPQRSALLHKHAQHRPPAPLHPHQELRRQAPVGYPPHLSPPFQYPPPPPRADAKAAVDAPRRFAPEATTNRQEDEDAAQIIGSMRNSSNHGFSSATAVVSPEPSRRDAAAPPQAQPRAFPEPKQRLSALPSTKGAPEAPRPPGLNPGHPRGPDRPPEGLAPGHRPAYAPQRAEAQAKRPAYGPAPPPAGLSPGPPLAAPAAAAPPPPARMALPSSMVPPGGAYGAAFSGASPSMLGAGLGPGPGLPFPEGPEEEAAWQREDALAVPDLGRLERQDRGRISQGEAMKEGHVRHFYASVSGAGPAPMAFDSARLSPAFPYTFDAHHQMSPHWGMMSPTMASISPHLGSPLPDFGAMSPSGHGIWSPTSDLHAFSPSPMGPAPQRAPQGIAGLTAAAQQHAVPHGHPQQRP